MITAWDIYWITRLDDFGILLGWIFGGGIVALMAWAIFGQIVMHDRRNGADDKAGKGVIYRRWLFRLACVPFIAGVVDCFTPSMREAAAIYLIPRITSNEDVQQIPANAARLLNGKLQEWIADMEGRNNEDTHN